MTEPFDALDVALGEVAPEQRAAAQERVRRDPAFAAEVARLRAVTEPLDALHDAWWLAAALADLPEDEAEVLRLRFGDGLTQREIAARMGIPLGTVKTRMVRALERVRPTIEAGS